MKKTYVFAHTHTYVLSIKPLNSKHCTIVFSNSLAIKLANAETRRL